MQEIIRSTRRLLAVSLMVGPGLLQAQSTAHYVPGGEGIQGASLPPPGFYVRDYNYAYFANQVNNAAGNSAGLGNFEAFTCANVPRHLEFMAEDRAQGQAFVLNLTGGVENPFLYVYVLHVVIAALLFKGREIFQITWLAISKPLLRSPAATSAAYTPACQT